MFSLELGSVTVNGTGGRQHRQVLQLAKRLPAASLNLFLDLREHATSVPDVTAAMRATGVLGRSSLLWTASPAKRYVRNSDQKLAVKSRGHCQTKFSIFSFCFVRCYIFTETCVKANFLYGQCH